MPKREKLMTLEDLVKAAHELGLRVTIELTPLPTENNKGKGQKPIGPRRRRIAHGA